VWTPQADAAGFVLLAPESGGMTWDAIRGEYGDDVARLDQALRYVFDRVNVDPKRIVMEGFSDGASYGIGLGLENRSLFTRIVANSPGFITFHDKRASGPKPRIFVSHGHQDQILPFELAGVRVVGQLRSEGYSVQFREFDGGHQVPVDVANEVAKFIMN
jgi:phospholipase/carboxylesterase